MAIYTHKPQNKMSYINFFDDLDQDLPHIRGIDLI